MSELLQIVERNIVSRELLADGQSLLIAVSGGVDSMVLLELLHELAKKHRWKLAVAHFNHHLRGRSSDADERLVRKTAAALKLRTFVSGADIKNYAAKKKISIEMAARALRHAFLAWAARTFKAADIATAHHADDQVELFFLRLLRGAGSEGLAGMQWKSVSPADTKLRLVRPLLNIPKGELEQFARAKRVAFREDVTNLQLDFQRNRVRHELIPVLEKLQPALRETVARAADVLSWESNFVLGGALEWLRDKRRAPFDELHPAVQRVCIRMQLRTVGLPSDFDLVEELRLRPDQPISIAHGTFVRRDASGVVHSEKSKTAEFLAAEARIDVDHQNGVDFGSNHFAWSFESRKGASLTPKTGTEVFDADKIGPQICLRHWRQGDRFQPIGMKSAVKLQDLFVNAKVPAQERRQKVVAVARNGEIFWVEGMRISDRFKLDNSTTRRFKWSWKRI